MDISIAPTGACCCTCMLRPEPQTSGPVLVAAKGLCKWSLEPDPDTTPPPFFPCRFPYLPLEKISETSGLQPKGPDLCRSTSSRTCGHSPKLTLEQSPPGPHTQLKQLHMYYMYMYMHARARVCVCVSTCICIYIYM